MSNLVLIIIAFVVVIGIVAYFEWRLYNLKKTAANAHNDLVDKVELFYRDYNQRVTKLENSSNETDNV